MVEIHEPPSLQYREKEEALVLFLVSQVLLKQLLISMQAMRSVSIGAPLPSAGFRFEIIKNSKGIVFFKKRTYLTLGIEGLSAPSRPDGGSS